MLSSAVLWARLAQGGVSRTALLIPDATRWLGACQEPFGPSRRTSPGTTQRAWGLFCFPRPRYTGRHGHLALRGRSRLVCPDLGIRSQAADSSATPLTIGAQPAMSSHPGKDLPVLTAPPGALALAHYADRGINQRNRSRERKAGHDEPTFASLTLARSGAVGRGSGWAGSCAAPETALHVPAGKWHGARPLK